MMTLGLFLNLIASIFLFLGSKETPWRIRTIGGASKTEKDFEKRRRTFANFGFLLLFFGFLLQFISVVKN